MSLPLLTKSQFMNGSQCSKRLWNEIHNPSIVSAANGDDLDRFAQGHALTAWARTLYSNGVLIEGRAREEADARQDLGDPSQCAGRVRRAAEPFHRDALSLARRRARITARLL